MMTKHKELPSLQDLAARTFIQKFEHELDQYFDDFSNNSGLLALQFGPHILYQHCFTDSSYQSIEYFFLSEFRKMNKSLTTSLKESLFYALVERFTTLSQLNYPPFTELYKNMKLTYHYTEFAIDLSRTLEPLFFDEFNDTDSTESVNTTSALLEETLSENTDSAHSIETDDGLFLLKTPESSLEDTPPTEDETSSLDTTEVSFGNTDISEERVNDENLFQIACRLGYLDFVKAYLQKAILDHKRASFIAKNAIAAAYEGEHYQLADLLHSHLKEPYQSRALINGFMVLNYTRNPLELLTHLWNKCNEQQKLAATVSLFTRDLDDINFSTEEEDNLSLFNYITLFLKFSDPLPTVVKDILLWVGSDKLGNHVFYQLDLDHFQLPIETCRFLWNLASPQIKTALASTLKSYINSPLFIKHLLDETSNNRILNFRQKAHLVLDSETIEKIESIIIPTVAKYQKQEKVDLEEILAEFSLEVRAISSRFVLGG